MLTRAFVFAYAVWTSLRVSLRRLMRGAAHERWTLPFEITVETLRGLILLGAARVATRSAIDGAGAGATKARNQQRRLPRGVERIELAGLRTELHTPDGWQPGGPVLLYWHGGGYVACSPATHRDLVARIARASGARCYVPNYRKAPRHPFPAAIDDAIACYRALLAQGIAPSSLVVGGDSAGGGLTLAMLLSLRDAGELLPRASILLSPWVDLEGKNTSVDAHAIYDYLNGELVRGAALQYAHSADLRHPLISPLHADLRGLPTTLMLTGELEVFHSEDMLFAERLRAAGVPLTHEIGAGMVHVYPVLAQVSREARAAIRSIAQFIVAEAAAAQSERPEARQVAQTPEGEGLPALP